MDRCDGYDAGGGSVLKPMPIPTPFPPSNFYLQNILTKNLSSSVLHLHFRLHLQTNPFHWKHPTKQIQPATLQVPEKVPPTFRSFQSFQQEFLLIGFSVEGSECIAVILSIDFTRQASRKLPYRRRDLPSLDGFRGWKTLGVFEKAGWMKIHKKEHRDWEN